MARCLHVYERFLAQFSHDNWVDIQQEPFTTSCCSIQMVRCTLLRIYRTAFNFNNHPQALHKFCAGYGLKEYLVGKSVKDYLTLRSNVRYSCKRPCRWQTMYMEMQAADLQKACAIARQDPGNDLAPTPADFQERVQSLAAYLLQVHSPVPSPAFCLGTGLSQH